MLGRLVALLRRPLLSCDLVARRLLFTNDSSADEGRLSVWIRAHKGMRVRPTRKCAPSPVTSIFVARMSLEYTTSRSVTRMDTHKYACRQVSYCGASWHLVAQNCAKLSAASLVTFDHPPEGCQDPFAPWASAPTGDVQSLAVK